MMNLMYTTGYGYPLLLGLHMLSVLVFAAGAAFLLLWAFKHLSPHALWKWGWILVVIGAVLCLLTFPGRAAFGMMGRGDGFGVGKFGMMGRWQGAPAGSESASQQEEEAKGKALYDTLQGHQITCADVSDTDFELIGEYVMGQRAGGTHEQMNAMMKQTMGDAGEEQMHIMLGRNATGCAPSASETSSTGPSSYRGMMRAFGSSASR